MYCVVTWKSSSDSVSVNSELLTLSDLTSPFSKHQGKNRALLCFVKNIGITKFDAPRCILGSNVSKYEILVSHRFNDHFMATALISSSMKGVNFAKFSANILTSLVA